MLLSLCFHLFGMRFHPEISGSDNRRLADGSDCVKAWGVRECPHRECADSGSEEMISALTGKDIQYPPYCVLN